MIMHSIKYQSTALLQKLLHRGTVMLWTHYKEYFKTAFYDVLGWREDIDTQNKNGPRVSESMKIHLCFLHVLSYPCSSVKLRLHKISGHRSSCGVASVQSASTLALRGHLY